VPEIRPATPADLDPVLDLLTVRSRRVFGVSDVSRAQLADAWRSDGAERVVTDGGYASLRGGEIAVAAEDASTMDALLEHLEARARAQGLAFLTAVVPVQDRLFDALVRRSGFGGRGEVLEMWRRLDRPFTEPVWPAGLSLRSYEPADGERVHALLDEAYAGWDDTYVPRPYAEWLSFMTEHDEFDPALWFLAERGGELVACALHWKEHQRRGWVKDIVVRADQRGAGLGRALLLAGFGAYRDRGVERVGLKVDSTNPTGAVALYGRVGFEVDRRYGIWVKQL
jgi:ribosomal protein S18 acetylase RimI-like enzyme